jgi:Fe-S-cluster containining protein
MSPLDEHLVSLRARVDQHFAQAVARTPTQFACRAGCDACCHQRFSVFEVEAAPIRNALARIEREDPEARRRIRERGLDPNERACALLIDGRCTVYEQRPLICRSHGLPIGVRESDEPGSALRVDCCPLNFNSPEAERDIPRASVLVLDAINQPLAVLAELTAPGQPRVALAQLAAAGAGATTNSARSSGVKTNSDDRPSGA